MRGNWKSLLNITRKRRPTSKNKLKSLRQIWAALTWNRHSQPFSKISWLRDIRRESLFSQMAMLITKRQFWKEFRRTVTKMGWTRCFQLELEMKQTKSWSWEQHLVVLESMLFLVIDRCESFLLRWLRCYRRQLIQHWLTAPSNFLRVHKRRATNSFFSMILSMKKISASSLDTISAASVLLCPKINLTLKFNAILQLLTTRDPKMRLTGNLTKKTLKNLIKLLFLKHRTLRTM